MTKDENLPKIPGDLREILSRLHELAGYNGMVAEVDWTNQTLSTIGQIGSNPEITEGEDREAIMKLSDRQIESMILDQFDIELSSRHVTDASFRYEFDISAYISEHAYLLQVRLHPDHSDKSLEQSQDHIEWKKVEQ